MSEQVLDFRSAKEKARLMDMSFDALNVLLVQVSDMPDCAQKDGYINLILEVMEERGDHPYHLSQEEIRLSWEDFCENYCGKDLETEADEMPESPPISVTSEKKTKKKMLPRILRGVAVAAVIVALFCGVASAFGYNMLQMVVIWGDGVFRFSPAETSLEETDQHAFWDLNQEVKKYSDLPLVPNYYLAGAAVESLTTEEGSKGTRIYATYQHEKGSISFRYAFYPNAADIHLSEYHINGRQLKTYESGGNTFYLFSNVDQMNIVWFVGNIGCSINGDFSEDEAKQMVDSLYEE